MAVFGALLLSVSVSGLLGVLAGSDWHVGWALAGLMFPGYSRPFLLYAGLKGWDWAPAPRRERGRARRPGARARWR